jgi:ABC-type branched-subunit amino acid transport system permease subunit
VSHTLRKPQWILTIVALLAALLAPLMLQTYWLHVIIIAYFYAILAASWALLAGYAGQFSFGHMALMAVGGYTTGLLGKYLNTPPLLGILLGTLGWRDRFSYWRTGFAFQGLISGTVYHCIF